MEPVLFARTPRASKERAHTQRRETARCAHQRRVVISAISNPRWDPRTAIVHAATHTSAAALGAAIGGAAATIGTAATCAGYDGGWRPLYFT